MFVSPGNIPGRGYVFPPAVTNQNSSTMFKPSYIFPVICLTLLSLACRKQGDPVNPNPPGGGLSYGDSIFYLRDQSYEISPLQARAGTYSAFPGNLLIDPATGRITVKIIGHGQESQTGLRYRIKYTSTDGSIVDSTHIVLAGINYLDQIYYLSQNDSIISPVYNAKLSNVLPGGTYGIAPDSRLAIDPVTGKININECIRRGMFDLPVENGEWEEVSVTYQSNDPSNNVTNRIDIALYFYTSLAEVPSNVSGLMREHQKMTLGVPQEEIPITSGPPDFDLPDNISVTRPRPPCIIIVAN